jgi:hypothetical protein
MSIARHFPSFVCVRCWASQQRATLIGVKEAKARGNWMMNFLRRVSKMRLISIGVIMEVLAFMQNSRHKGLIVEEDG